jgi:putative copper resistance protein D
MDLVGFTARGTHAAALASVVGAFGVLLLIARPAARAAGDAEGRTLRLLDARIRCLIWIALGVTTVAGLLDLWRQIAVVSGVGLRESLDSARGLAVLLDTRYGAVWLARHGLLVLLAGLLLFADDGDDADWVAVRAQGLGLSATSLVLGSAAGHAASAEMGTPAIVLDALHLLATGLWAGGLLPLALALAWTARLAPEAGLIAAGTAATRFSHLALPAVVSLAATGAVAAWEQVGGIPSLVGTPYGHWLAFKIGLFLVVLGLAAGNRLVWRPRLVAGGAAAVGAADRLRRRVLGEAALAAGILAVAAVLGLLTPGRHSEISWPLPFRLDWDATRTLPGVRSRVAVGSQLATLGLVAALLALVVRPRRWHLVGLGGALGMLLGAGVALPPIAIDANPGTYLRPGVPYAASSIVEGESLYRLHCQGCHGPFGYGDGPGATSLPRRPADLTARHAADHTAGDLFWWISHGIPGSGMPAFADRLSTDDRWDIINFVRTLSASEQARDLGPVASARPVIAAPDFAFTVGVGEERALRDWRGRGAVLLVLFTLPASADRLVTLNELSVGLRLAGGEVLGVPLRDPAAVYRALGARAIHFPIAVDGAPEAAATYTLFGRDLVAGARRADASPPVHLELLVDRRGYLRARWIPRDVTRDRDGWADPRALLSEVERLAREAVAAPIVAEHIH